MVFASREKDLVGCVTECEEGSKSSGNGLSLTFQEKENELPGIQEMSGIIGQWVKSRVFTEPGLSDFGELPM